VLEDTLTPELMILRNTVMGFVFVVFFAVLKDHYQGWTLLLLLPV